MRRTADTNGNIKKPAFERGEHFPVDLFGGFMDVEPGTAGGERL